MRIGIGGNASTLEGIVSEAVSAEEAGLATFSTSNIFGHDAVSALTVAAARTSRIELLTAVVPCLPRHPLALAQQALTAQVAAQGRFTLGLGSSHEVVVAGSYRLGFQPVASRIEEYLRLLVPLLAQERVETRGRFFGAKGRISAPDAMATPCLLAALGPRMLWLAGEYTQGTVLWLAGSKAVRNEISPPLLEASAAARRPAPRIICGLPIALTDAKSGAREYVNQIWGGYASLPSYRRMLEAEGVRTPAEVALVGDESDLDGALQQLEDAGVTTFLGTLIDFEEGCAQRTLGFLGSRGA